MRLSVKRPSEFEDPRKLSKEQVPSNRANSNHPYTQSRSSRTKTQGLFATDPQRTAVTKYEGDH